MHPCEEKKNGCKELLTLPRTSYNENASAESAENFGIGLI